MQAEDVKRQFDLEGRVVIVTGGTRGIGRAIAEATAALGAKVVVASRKPAACAETQAAIEADGGTALGVATHLGDLAALRGLVEATVERFGGIDVVVNNAANALALPLGQFTEDAWSKVFDVDLRGPVFLIQEALPYLEASEHASVINVISAGAFMFAANTAMYSAAKAAFFRSPGRWPRPTPDGASGSTRWRRGRSTPIWSATTHRRRSAPWPRPACNDGWPGPTR